MLETAKRLLGGEYDNLCRVEIRAKNLVENYKILSKKLPIAPVLKSNAYGHGLVLAAKILDKLHPPFFCVDSLFEAYELSKAGIKSQILIMGYVSATNLRHKKLSFAFAAYDKENLLNIAKYQPQAEIHLFVDTGMSREGIPLKNLPEIIKVIKRNKIKIAGLMSHPARPGAQVTAFHRAQEMLPTKWAHMGFSGNVARVGLDLYLTNPVLRFMAKIVQSKKIEKGNKVGYDGTFTAKKKMTLALLPAGYNEGIDRRLSNKGVVKIRGKFCPIVGRVSMNLTSVDVSKVPNIKVGDEAIIISDKHSNPNSVINIAKTCKTIPYEILVHIQPSLKRVRF